MKPTTAVETEVKSLVGAADSLFSFFIFYFLFKSIDREAKTPHRPLREIIAWFTVITLNSDFVNVCTQRSMP